VIINGIPAFENSAFHDRLDGKVLKMNQL